jgi:hypothetical protein
MAVEFVLSKSKLLKDKIEVDKLSDLFINQAVARNNTFLIAYNSFL